MTFFIKFIFIFSSFYSTCYAHELSHKKENTMTSTQSKKLSTLLTPNLSKLLLNEELDFNLVLTHKGMHNEQSINLYRFEPQTTMQLDSQHISFLLNDTGKLQGFVRLLPQYQSTEQRVAKDTALAITQKFLEVYSPDLLENYENKWIDVHDENIIINGKKITLTGMKVKCRDLNTGLYFWTIIAPDETVMVFERDIK